VEEGYRKLSVSMPYFEEIIDYLILKNKQIGSELLEDFFKSIYPNRKRSEKHYLKKCIRHYLLNMSDAKPNEDGLVLGMGNGYERHYTTLIGIEGRRTALMLLFQGAEKLTVPSQITIFEADQLTWALGDMLYLRSFFQKIRKLLDFGHKIEFIIFVQEIYPQGFHASYEVHKLFMEIGFHDHLTIRTFVAKSKLLFVTSLYSLPKRMVVVGYHPEGELPMMSLLYRDGPYIAMQEAALQSIREASTPILVSNKNTDMERVLTWVKSSWARNEAYYCSGKVLSFTTMSEGLLHEILNDNHVTENQRKLCFEVYHSLRFDVEHRPDNSMSGFYYILDEISSVLTYDTLVNYPLSLLTGKNITMTRAQYLKHFQDTADLLQKDSRYRVILHFSELQNSELLWCKDETWALVVHCDKLSGALKFMFSDEVKTISIHQAGFTDVFEKVPDHKKDNGYVSEIFYQIAKGEGFGSMK